MCDHALEPGGREAAMIVVQRDTEGIPSVWCDPCLVDLVAALNDAGLSTVASCCGHRRRPVRITLRDGRDLFIAPTFDEGQRVADILTAGGYADINAPVSSPTPIGEPE